MISGVSSSAMVPCPFDSLGDKARPIRSVEDRHAPLATSAFSDAAQGEHLLDGVQVATRGVLGKGEL